MNYPRIREGIHANYRAGKYQLGKFIQAARICGEIHRRELYKRLGPSKTGDTCRDLRKELEA